MIFQDEVPNAEDRQTVLNYLAWSPAAVECGIVEVNDGLIFRYSKNPWVRAGSVVLLVGAILLSLAIVIGAAYLPLASPITDPQQRAVTFAMGWVAVLVGVIAHLGIAGVKREQATKLPTIVVVTNLGKTINARLGQIIWKLLLVLLGLFAVVFAIDPAVGPLNAFLVGYSLDSIIGIFGTNIETRVKAMQTQLTPK
jgi:hypothetical protein